MPSRLTLNNARLLSDAVLRSESRQSLRREIMRHASRLTVLFFSLVAPMTAQQVVIDFDALTAPFSPVTTPLYVSNQFASQGVIFGSDFGGGMGVVGSSNPVSAPNVVVATDSTGLVNYTQPVWARFELQGGLAVVDSVSVSLTSSSANSTLEAYDTNGQLVGAASGAANAILSVTAVGLINNVRILQGPMAFDDFTFSNLRLALPCAEGTLVGAGGALEDVLRVNGSIGGPSRVVTSPVGQSITIALSQPSGNPNPAGYLIFGVIGRPQVGGAFTTPWGDLCFPPSLVVSSPALFLLANGFVPSSGLVPATLTPWSYTTLPINSVFEFGLQAIVVQNAQASNNLAVSNFVGIAVR